MARQILDTTAGAGDTGKAGGDKINANFAELYARVAQLESGTATPTPTPAPSPTLSLSSAVVQNEGNSGTSSFVWTLTLARNGSTAAFPYSYAVTGNGADAADFGGTFPSGSGTFAAGETSKTITILVTGDTAVEGNEGFVLTVTAAGLNTVTSNGTISNDDSAPTGPKTTFPIPSGGALLYTMDPDSLAGADNSRVTTHTDPASSITATAPGIGPVLKKNLRNGRAGLRFAVNDAERLSLGKPAAITSATGVAAGWSVVVVVAALTGNGSFASVLGSDFSNSNLYMTGNSGGANGMGFGIHAGDAAADVHTLIYSGDTNTFGNTGTGRAYRDGVITGTGPRVLGPAGGLDILIGSGRNSGNGGFTGEFGGDVLYIAIVQGAWTPAEALQVHFWACTRFGRALPTAGRTYFPVFDGDSITYGTGSTNSSHKSYPSQLAIKRSWPVGAWANVGKPSAAVNQTGGMVEKAPRDTDGFAEVTGLPVVLVAGEWHNQGFTGGTTQNGIDTANNNRAYATLRKATTKFAKIIGWTSTSSTREGTARDSFNQSLMTTPGDFDSMIAMHTNALVGVNGQNVNATYFADGIHPTDAGYLAMRDVIDTGMIAAGYST